VPGNHPYDLNAVVSVQAVPNAGYSFDHWTGDVSAGSEQDNPLTVTMDQDRSITPVFAAAPTYALTITAGAGGTTNPPPGTYTYDEGATPSILATAASGYRFGGWSGSVSGATNPIAITMNGNKTVTANFIRLYTLTIAASAGGTTSPAPGIYTYDQGTSVSVQAIPGTAYQFDGWSGDASGTASPVSVVMIGNKSILASFSKAVKPPLSVTAARLINRSVSLVENVIRLTWQTNPANTNILGYRIYRIDSGGPTLIGQVAVGTTQYLVRNLQASAAYQFGVTAVNAQGWESDMTLITVQSATP